MSRNLYQKELDEMIEFYKRNKKITKQSKVQIELLINNLEGYIKKLEEFI